MTMLAFLVILLVLIAASCALVLDVARRAPEGYEDEDGFQLGPMPPDLGMREVGAAAAVRDEAGRDHAGTRQVTGSSAPNYGASVAVFWMAKKHLTGGHGGEDGGG